MKKIRVILPDFHCSTGQILDADTGEDLEIGNITGLVFRAVPGEMNELVLIIHGASCDVLAERGKFKFDVWFSLFLWWQKLKEKMRRRK